MNDYTGAYAPNICPSCHDSGWIGDTGKDWRKCPTCNSNPMKTNDTNTPQTRDTDKYPVTVEHVESTVFNGTKLSHNCICSLDKDHGQIPELITQATRQARLDELERVGVFLKSDYHINNHISQRIKELKNGK